MTNIVAKTIEVTDLGVVRGGRSVFAGLSFEVTSGQLLILKGANGSGKSSLLRTLAGLLPFQHGSLTMNDHDMIVDPIAWTSALHFIGHADAIKPVWTLRQNLCIFAATALGQHAAPEEIEAAASMLGLSDLLDQPAQYFSKGQYHRASLARLGIGMRSVWLLDEPTVGLDSINRVRLADMINTHLSLGGIAVIATHDDLGIDAKIEKKIIPLDDYSCEITVSTEYLL